MADIDIMGTFEFIQGSALGEFDEDGEFVFEGDTEMFWDTAETVTDDKGNIVVLDRRTGDTYIAIVTDDGIDYRRVRVEYDFKVVPLK